MLKCYSCATPHNLDEYPDVGICNACGGTLVEEGETPPEDLLKSQLVDLFGSLHVRTKKSDSTSN